MDYRPISSRERLLLEEIETRSPTVFTPHEAAMIMGVDRATAHGALSRLEDKGAVIRLERGKYILDRFYRELDVYEIAPHIARPSYLSLWSGLHYYGLTDQVPGRVYVMVTRARPGLELHGRPIRFVKVRNRLFFGYRMAGRVVVAEREKLLLDCLAFPAYAGGIGELGNLVEDGLLDMEKLVEYAVLTGSATVCSRLGYLLETARRDFDAELLRHHRSVSRVLLDPTGPRENLERSPAWNVMINAEV